MTKTQQAKVEDLKQYIFESDSYGSPANYEYKRFEVEEWNDNVIVTTSVGLKGDEGTAAELFARSNRVIMVGPRGGLRAYDARTKKSVTGRKAKYVHAS